MQRKFNFNLKDRYEKILNGHFHGRRLMEYLPVGSPGQTPGVFAGREVHGREVAKHAVFHLRGPALVPAGQLFLVPVQDERGNVLVRGESLGQEKGIAV